MHPTTAIGICLLASLSPNLVSAQAPTGDWTISCETKSCSLSLRATDPQSGRQVATLLIGLADMAPDTIRFGVALPLGLSLDAGVRIVVDDKMIALPFEVCFPDGCRAMRQLDGDEAGAVISAATLDVRFFPFGSSNLVSVSVQSEGTDAAIFQARQTLSLR